MDALALYTTIYPGVESFLPDWCRSVRGQTDNEYRLWIGLDTLGIDAVKDAMGVDLDATWVAAPPGETPAQVRQRALARIVESCDGVVLVDSDDVLHPSRVASARAALHASDLVGCAMRLVDAQCQDLGEVFGLPEQRSPDEVLPRNNIFGLSNSSFRSDLLRRCLPIPSTVMLIDWFLATRAWLSGASLAFDPEVGMDYRQHGANMARVRPPFSPQQVFKDTQRVRQHFQIVRTVRLEAVNADRFAELARVAADIESFHTQVALQPMRLDRYVQALNLLETAPLWWSCVAHPALRRMWMPERSPS
jgi:hypothetical protein